MHIIVTIKQVIDTTEVGIDRKTGTLIRDGVPAIMNPEDKHALEAALRIRAELAETRVTALSMGPPQARTTLMEALCMGADHACLACDKAFAGADTLATAYTLARAIKKIGGFDLILCGSQAIDGDTAQVGPQVAECLGIAQLTYAQSLGLTGKRVEIESAFGRTRRRIASDLPALVTVCKGINRPRYKTMNGIARAFRDNSVQVFNRKDLDADSGRIGLNGSPTSVKSTFAPSLGRRGRIVEGETDTLCQGILRTLRQETLLPGGSAET